MTLTIPNFLSNQLKKDYNEILELLIKKDYNFEEIPSNATAKYDEGEAFSLAHPIQGMLKYHGFANSQKRISFFPSISLNNGALFTVSYLNFDKHLEKDIVFLNGTSESGDTYKKVVNSLDFIRSFSRINTKAMLISRNVSPSKVAGKGLGTSASGSAALGLAAMNIIYNNSSEFISNNRLISIFSRYLSGSGCRSASGGISLWLSHPKIDPFDSFAIRLDREEHHRFIDNISLLTIPIRSNLKTTEAHKIAPKSPFFEAWLLKRKELVLEFIEALDNEDLSKIGTLTEFDTLCLHAVAMTAPNDQNIIAWQPDTLKIMQMVRELRENKLEVYFSIDTGPSLVLITKKSSEKEVYTKIQEMLPNQDIINGKLGGSSKLLDQHSPEIKILEKDISKFKE